MNTIIDRFRGKTFIKVFIICVIVLISRIPFLSAGYGVDPDAWRFVSVIEGIAKSGQYELSTLPGHPVQELISTLLWKTGPIGLNGLTALMSVLAVIYFIFILKKLNFKNIYLPALALAFTPVVFINSVNTRDYIWALAFLLPAIYFVLNNKPITAGIFLGLANACRITSLLILIPLLIILYYQNDGKNKFRYLIHLTVSSGISTLILFIPVFIRYGLNFTKGYVGANPGFIYIVFRILFSTWGFIGFSAILAATIIQLFIKTKKYKNDSNPVSKLTDYINLSLFAGIILFILVFLILPHKAGYLIPVIPLTIILLGRILNHKLFNFVCIALIISPFFMSISNPDYNISPEYSNYTKNIKIAGKEINIDILKGPMLAEHDKRLKQYEYVDSIFAKGKQLTRKSVILCGETVPMVVLLLPGTVQGNAVYDYLLDSAKLKHYTENKYDIYYLPEEDIDNVNCYNINPADYGGKNLFKK